MLPGTCSQATGVDQQCITYVIKASQLHNAALVSADAIAVPLIGHMLQLLYTVLLMLVPLVHAGAPMQMPARVTGVQCMLVVRMLLAGAVRTAATTASCSAVQHTLAMYVASVLLATAPLSHSIADHA
jgi:hypothetical protein